MKAKVLLFTFLLLSISLLKGQEYTYTPFVEEGTRWSYAFISGVYPVDYKAVYFSYQLKGDTTITGLNYKKLLYGCSDEYIAALREENKKVFIVEQEDERLLFDFNLKEGDRMECGSVEGMLVTKIDTVLIGETKRKRFVFESGYETWIEGIGALEDFYPLQGRLLSYETQGINYQKKETEIAYKTDEWYFNADECDYNDLQSPLPSYPLRLIQRKGEIELLLDATDGLKSGWIYVCSMQGNVLYAKPVQKNASIIIIPTSGFANGAYIVRFIDEKSKKSWNRKVVLH